MSKANRFGSLWLTLWHSPTVTTWGNLAVQSISLLLITSLILTRLPTLEIAAFYLFAATVTLASLLAQRVTLTFTRLFAFAGAGATDLGPIVTPRASPGQGSTSADRWQSLRRAFGMAGWIYVGCAAFSTTICSLLGAYGIYNLQAGAASTNHLWASLAIVATGSFFDTVLRRYEAALRGLDHVALVNRWNALFSVCRMVVIVGVLWLGGNLLAIVAAQQLVLLASGLWSRWLLLRAEPRFRSAPAYRFHRDILSAAWEPTWRGLVAQLSFTGVAQFSGIIFTRWGDPVAVAGYLLALRLITTLAQMSQAPFASRQPRFAHLRAAGRLDELKTTIERRILISLGLFSVSCLALGLVAEPLLGLLDTQVTFIPLAVWLVMSQLHLHDRFNILSLGVCATANVILFHWHQLAATVVSIVALVFLIGPWGLWGIILAIGVPRAIILAWGPARVAAESLRQSTWGYTARTYLAVFVVHSLAVVSGLWLTLGH